MAPGGGGGGDEGKNIGAPLRESFSRQVRGKKKGLLDFQMLENVEGCLCVGEEERGGGEPDCTHLRSDRPLWFGFRKKNRSGLGDDKTAEGRASREGKARCRACVRHPRTWRDARRQGIMRSREASVARRLWGRLALPSVRGKEEALRVGSTRGSGGGSRGEERSLRASPEGNVSSALMGHMGSSPLLLVTCSCQLHVAICLCRGGVGVF